MANRSFTMKVRPASGPDAAPGQGLLQGVGDECADRIAGWEWDHAALARDLCREAHITRSRGHVRGRRPQCRQRERMTRDDREDSLPRAVWALGLTSLFMDTSSELIHGLLPVFLVVTLGASATALGLVEGIAEATAQITRVFSGWLSDALGKRKALTVAGYGLAAVTKPLFPLANSIGLVLLARFLDRIGKGIRGAPRDALVADLTPAEQRGAAFGLRQSLDTVGATLGPAAAIVLMYLFNDDIRTVLWFAVIPAVLAVTVLVFGVEEPAHLEQKPKAPLRLADIRRARVGLLARDRRRRRLHPGAVQRGLPRHPRQRWRPSARLGAGGHRGDEPRLCGKRLSGRAASGQGRRAASCCLSASLVLIAADLVLGFGASLVGIFLGIGLWGLHMGLTQGVLAALIAATAPDRLRGTAFGLFGLVTGVASLIASVLAGLLWDRIGADATFSAGAAFAALAFIAFLPCTARADEPRWKSGIGSPYIGALRQRIPRADPIDPFPQDERARQRLRRARRARARAAARRRRAPRHRRPQRGHRLRPDHRARAVAQCRRVHAHLERRWRRGGRLRQCRALRRGPCRRRARAPGRQHRDGERAAWR